MIPQMPIGWINTGLPAVLLVGLAAFLPNLFSDPRSTSQRRLALAIGLSALCLLAAGMTLLGLSYSLRGHDVTAIAAADPLGAFVYFLRLAGLTGLIWLPVLALVWYVLAQRVERNRGEARARSGRG